MTREVSLLVNDKPIQLDYFVQGFIDHTVGGMVSSLEGVGEIKNLDISIDRDAVEINLNGAPVPANPFVNKIFRSTIAGMLSALKGIKEINKVNISIKR